MEVASMTKAVPSTASVLATLAGVTWRRLVRGRAIWVVMLIALLPAALASLGEGRDQPLLVIGAIQSVVMALLPPIFVASSIGEEIEDRTTTYLWSRPIGRWTIVVGKLLALAPLAAALIVGGWFVAYQIAAGAPPPVQSILAFAAGAVAISTIAAGVAVLVPKHGMALSIIYLVVFDQIIGNIPASLQTISVTRQVRLLAGVTPDAPNLVEPAVTMIAIAGVWLAIGLVRLRRLES
jgi:ABC-type transport system involved in multi-copper enzyme maturation permease subunit